MGLTWSTCSLRLRSLKHNKHAASDVQVTRISPFGRFRSSSRSLDLGGSDQPRSLLDISVQAVCENLTQITPRKLDTLPVDLAQLVLDRLNAAQCLNETAITALRGQQFYSFDLTAIALPITATWMRCLCTPTLERAVLSKTTVSNEGLCALAGLPRLTHLHLEHCIHITDEGLACIQDLSALTELSLAGCGEVTGAGLRRLGGLRRLRRLSLEMCHRVDGLGVLGQMSELESLSLGWCGAVTNADMAVVGRLTGLQELNISYTQVGDPGLGPLSPLTQLSSLGLGGLPLSDAAVTSLLRLLPLLRTLCLERCPSVGDGALRALATVTPPLEELNLAYSGCGDEGVARLSHLTALRALTLDKCDRVGDRGAVVVSTLRNLERLDLTDTRITNVTLKAVGRLQHLRSLNLSFTGVSDSGMRHLSRCTTLRHLTLDSDPSWGRLSDAGLAHLTSLTNLECLDLFAARVTDLGCCHISKLPRLQCLEVCSGYVTDVGVGALAAGLRRLRHLSLAHNRRVSSSSLPALAQLTGLTALNLSECGVSAGIVVLSSLTNLDTLALRDTKVRPAAAEKLKALLPGLMVQGVGSR